MNQLEGRRQHKHGAAPSSFLIGSRWKKAYEVWFIDRKQFCTVASSNLRLVKELQFTWS